MLSDIARAARASKLEREQRERQDKLQREAEKAVASAVLPSLDEIHKAAGEGHAGIMKFTACPSRFHDKLIAELLKARVAKEYPADVRAQVSVDFFKELKDKFYPKEGYYCWIRVMWD